MPKRAGTLMKMKIPKAQLDELVRSTLPKLNEENSLRDVMDRLEMEFLSLAMTQAHGNRTIAGGILGLNRTTVVEKLRRFGWMTRSWVCE